MVNENPGSGNWYDGIKRKFLSLLSQATVIHFLSLQFILAETFHACVCLYITFPHPCEH